MWSCRPLALGDDVVDLEVPEREHHPATAVVALLVPEQGVPVGPVVRQVAQIGAPWNVAPV